MRQTLSVLTLGTNGRRITKSRRLCGALCHRSKARRTIAVPMRSNDLSSVMPAQRHPAALRGGDPVFAGIHAFLASLQLKDVDGRDKPGHDSEMNGSI